MIFFQAIFIGRWERTIDTIGSKAYNDDVNKFLNLITMKTKIFALVAGLLMMTSVYAATSVDSLTVNGITVCINDEYTVFPTDMSEFDTVSFIKAFPIENPSGSDWASVYKGDDGSFYLSEGDVYIKVSGEDAISISYQEFAESKRSFIMDGGIASFAEPIGKFKYKYVWGFDSQHKAYLIVYGRA